MAKTKEASISAKVGPGIKQDFDRIKDMIKVVDENVNNKVVMEAVVLAAKAVFDVADEGVVSGLVSGDTSLLDTLLNEAVRPEISKDTEGSFENRELEVIKDLKDRTDAAIKDLKEGSPQDLDGHGEFTDLSVIESGKEFSESHIPAVYTVVDTDTQEVLCVVGAHELSRSTEFMTKAIKKGRANRNKTEEQLLKRYGNKAGTYKKFVEIAKSENISYEVMSYHHPKSVEGRAVVLELIRRNKGAHYDIQEFASTI